LINQLRKENDDLQMRISSLEADNEAQKDEVKEVLKALEELAINFDQKQQEAENKSKENENLTIELDRKLTNLKSIEDELETLKEVAQNQRKRILDMMITLLKDLGEIGVIVGGSLTNEFKKPSMDNFENAEEDFTMARLYVSKLKGETKILTQRCSTLEEQKTESEKIYETKVKELEECRLNLVQNEARLKSQQDYSKDLEQKKRTLEEEIDTLREELAKVKAQGSVFYVLCYLLIEFKKFFFLFFSLYTESVSGLNTTSDEVQKAFKEKLESHIEQLKKQLKEVRDENDKNQKKSHELQEYLEFLFFSIFYFEI
jgi:kinesin family member 5